MTRIVLTRHGHVDGISPERFRGRTELALTSRGIAEAHAVARRIAGGWSPVAVYSSPLQRCLTTARFITDACRCPLEVLEELNDMNYGQLQWKSREEASVEFPQLVSNWFSVPQLARFPGGDSLQELVARTSTALTTVLSRHARDTVVLVGHDSVNRALLLQLLDQPLCAFWRLAQAPCGINEIEILDGHIRVERINETAHLEHIQA